MSVHYLCALTFLSVANVEESYTDIKIWTDERSDVCELSMVFIFAQIFLSLVTVNKSFDINSYSIAHTTSPWIMHS